MFVEISLIIYFYTKAVQSSTTTKTPDKTTTKNPTTTPLQGGT